MEFKDLSNAVAKQFSKMPQTGLFRINIDGVSLWETYLKSFPEGSNPVFQKRTEHDCSACRGFIKKIGSVVTIKDGKIVTIWDAEVGGAYQTVVDAMAEFVRLGYEVSGVENIFLSSEPDVGVLKTRAFLEDKTVKEWGHFFVNLPEGVVSKGRVKNPDGLTGKMVSDIGPKLSDARATKDVMLRSLKELTMDSVDTMLDLIAQNSLYRGAEQRFAVESFRKFKVAFDKLPSDQAKDLYCWSMRTSAPEAVTRIRNTAAGTFLVDLSEGMGLEEAVRRFEVLMAPSNYKRSSAPVSKMMLKQAEEKVKELGYSSALERRFAVIEDITINNVIFANKDAKKSMSVFDQVAETIPEKAKNLEKVEEISIDDFINKIVPMIQSMEILVENRLAGNFVSLIAPGDPTAKLMFKWSNPFSWCYLGGLTDSIKERVKKAGGSVTGHLRCSLSWSNHDDLDLHLHEPNGNHINFANKKNNKTHGQLDVDMNAGGRMSRKPVENITFPDRNRMDNGQYTLTVHNFAQREMTNVGFEVEMEVDGQVFHFTYPQAVRNKETIQVAKFRYGKKTDFEMIEALPHAKISKNMWGIPTETFRKVSVLMLSPNYWDDQKSQGNKHWFFMLENCISDDRTRGIFNEYLVQELNEHRKVFEQVGARMSVENSDRQLSGLGFSSTKHDSVLCRVKGSFSRTLKINF